MNNRVGHADRWYTNVRSHVSKAEWERPRKMVSARAGHVCEICGGRGSKWPVECQEVFADPIKKHQMRFAGLDEKIIS
jgi:hypothetical protein